MPKPPTTTANHYHPPSTTNRTTTDHHQRNRLSSNATYGTPPRTEPHRHLAPLTTAHLKRLRIADNLAPPTLANLRRSHTSYHRAPPTTAHFRPLLSSVNSKQITHILSSPIFIISFIFIHHPPHLK